jgi:hypothetical protein
MITMPMEPNYVSELRPQKGVLFIARVIYGHRKPLRDVIDRGKLLIYQEELSGNPTSYHLIANQEELGEVN